MQNIRKDRFIAVHVKNIDCVGDEIAVVVGDKGWTVRIAINVIFFDNDIIQVMNCQAIQDSKSLRGG